METVKYIQIRCPDLYVSTSRDEYIVMAQERLSASVFGNSNNLAVALCAMHLFTVDTMGASGTDGVLSSAGNISSLSEGQLSVSLDTTAANNKISGSFAAYNTTRYGKELVDLITSVVFCPMNRI